MQFKTLTD